MIFKPTNPNFDPSFDWAQVVGLWLAQEQIFEAHKFKFWLSLGCRALIGSKTDYWSPQIRVFIEPRLSGSNWLKNRFLSPQIQVFIEPRLSIKQSNKCPRCRALLNHWKPSINWAQVVGLWLDKNRFLKPTNPNFDPSFDWARVVKLGFLKPTNSSFNWAQVVGL